MERCPNCNTLARLGAKFCTTCGFQFDGDEDTPYPTAQVSGIASDSPDLGNDAAHDESESGGWPAAPSSTESAPNDEEPGRSDPVADDSDTDAAQYTDYVGFWPEPTSEPWPTPVSVSNEGIGPKGPAPALDSQMDEPLSAFEPTEPTDRAASARGDFRDLLDRLRDAIDAMDEGAPLDLSGVVSDLEVAVTPPGALPPDDVAELREALFAARERPRDIDTMVDLAKRIDALVALVIAYDRAIAAIERSLDALKRAEQPVDVETPSPGSDLQGEELGKAQNLH